MNKVIHLELMNGTKITINAARIETIIAAGKSCVIQMIGEQEYQVNSDYAEMRKFISQLL